MAIPCPYCGGEYGHGYGCALASTNFPPERTPQVITSDPAVLRPKAAAHYSGMTVSWFKADRARKTGPTVPYVQLTSTAVGYRRVDLDRWIESRMRGVLSNGAEK